MGATKLVYVIVGDKPHIMNVATGVRAAARYVCCCASHCPGQVLDQAACERLLNGTDEWHQRQRELAQKISAGAQQQRHVDQSESATPKPFVVHSRFRPWTFKNAKKK